METVSLVGSIVSVIIGGFAIWLAVTFYRMSNKISEDTKEAAKGISDSVSRLETLFDRLYSDTFSVMKDTVSDMRRHIWPEKEESTEALTNIKKESNAKISELSKQLNEELESIMKRVGHTDSKIDGVEKNVKALVERAIEQTRRVESEAQEERLTAYIGRHILSLLKQHGHMSAKAITSYPGFIKRFTPAELKTALFDMLKKREITVDGDIENEDTTVTIW